MRKALLLALLLLACRPDFGLPASLVASQRILAVRAVPAEASPGSPIQLQALAVSPAGTDGAPQLQWAFCGSPRPATDNNVAPADCMGGAVRPLAGPSAVLPTDACLLYGPDTPPQVPGQPPFRARDPDVTGGYYQPLRVLYAGEATIALPRILCNLGQAPGEVARSYRERYQPNANPVLRGVDAPPQARAGQKVTLTARWDPQDAESFLVYDVASQSLREQREALRVSWFATAGKFEHDTTGRGAGEIETSTDVVWEAPLNAGAVHLWAVLRDSRGGVDFRAFDVAVLP